MIEIKEMLGILFIIVLVSVLNSYQSTREINSALYNVTQNGIDGLINSQNKYFIDDLILTVGIILVLLTLVTIAFRKIVWSLTLF